MKGRDEILKVDVKRKDGIKIFMDEIEGGEKEMRKKGRSGKRNR